MTFEKEGQILKMALPQKNGHRIKTPSSKLTILVSSCWEKNFICNNAHNFFIPSLVFLKLLIVSVAFFLGHPVYVPSWFLLRIIFNNKHSSCKVLPIYANSGPDRGGGGGGRALARGVFVFWTPYCWFGTP